MRNKKARTIEVVIQADGNIEIEAIGFLGTHCENITPFLEEALGTVHAKRKKPEYYVRSSEKQKRQQTTRQGGTT